MEHVVLSNTVLARAWLDVHYRASYPTLRHRQHMLTVSQGIPPDASDRRRRRATPSSNDRTGQQLPGRAQTLTHVGRPPPDTVA